MVPSRVGDRHETDRIVSQYNANDPGQLRAHRRDVLPPGRIDRNDKPHRAQGWKLEEVGMLNATPRHCEASVRLLQNPGEDCDAVRQAIPSSFVMHSTANNECRLKRIDREIGKSKQTLLKTLADETKREFFCRSDAEAAASRLHKSGTDLHRIEAVVTTKIRYGRGRPPKNRPRKVVSVCFIDLNLIERVLRQYVAEHNATFPGWDNKPTTCPTTFMMSTKFIGLQFVKMRGLRRLARPLNDVQRIYLTALSLSERALVMP